MTWNTMTPEERVTDLINKFMDTGFDPAREEAVACAEIFVEETLSMLPAAAENEKEIMYWKEVQELLNNY